MDMVIHILALQTVLFISVFSDIIIGSFFAINLIA